MESVNRAERTVTLKTAEGKTRTVTLGKEAVNFDQIEPGDQVRATLAEEVAVAVYRAGAAAPGPGKRAAAARCCGTRRAQAWRAHRVDEARDRED